MKYDCHCCHTLLTRGEHTQVLVIDGDNLVSHPWEEVRRVEEFLGIPNQLGHESVYYLNEQTGYYCLAIGERSWKLHKVA